MAHAARVPRGGPARARAVNHDETHPPLLSDNVISKAELSTWYPSRLDGRRPLENGKFL